MWDALRSEMARGGDRVSRWRSALVTGASSGIGEAVADELASMHVQPILVGRNLAALETVADRARSHKVDPQVVCADLGTDEGISKVESIIEAAESVDLLVNCAGRGQWGSFVDLPLPDAEETILVNTLALVRLTHAVLPRMLKNGRGTLIQIASMAAMGPGPQQAVYAATKAFVSSFGQALTVELESSPVTCTTVLPGFTRTNYFARVGLSPDVPDSRWMTSAELAHMCLAAAASGRPLVIPGGRNRLEIAVSSPFPSLVKGRTVARARAARSRLVPHRVAPSATASKELPNRPGAG